MRPFETLRPQLKALNGQDYMAYQSLKGGYAYKRFQLHVNAIPKDPYAPPGTGSFRVTVPRSNAGMPEDCLTSRSGNIAFRDFLARQFHKACTQHCPGRRGTGNSGLMTIAEPGQEILDRTSIHIDETNIEARIFLGFPATGRNINAQIAETMLFGELPCIVESSLFADTMDHNAFQKHIHAAVDAECLRRKLPELGLVAFIADNAILPRSSGIDARPLDIRNVVPFKTPDSLRVDVDLPHSGRISGMGIPKGVTLIVGGGYHGKSTILQALESGIYNHIPGDGRELCVCLPTAVKIRASSGRSITNTDISAFINHLPLQQNTMSFNTQNASGSTSQAAFVSESIEAGAGVLLMDEDTCATNFMIRDARMQQLVNSDEEPITAFVDKIKPLFQELDVSTIMVMGGSGDYFDVADCVIQMMAFQPRDVTGRVRDILRTSPSQRASEGSTAFARPRDRVPFSSDLNARNEYGHFRITAHDIHHLTYGKNDIDLSDIEQIKEIAQTRAIGYAIDHAKKFMDGCNSIQEVTERVIMNIADKGLDVLDPKFTGHLAAFRTLDLAAVLNRIRGLTLLQRTSNRPTE